MNLDFNGIQLTAPAGQVAMSHSATLDFITGQSSTQNMDWSDKLCCLPWDKLKEAFPEAYENTGRYCSLAHLDYQVCNGGISQYFGNGYHEARVAKHDDDVDLYDIDEQKKDFADMVKFAQTLFPNRVAENQALETAQKAFDALIFEENAEMSEWIECEEDEHIFNEETGEWEENPDWFESYEESYEEDYIHNAEGFDDKFYAANDYLEELLEYFAQAQCKCMARDIGTIEKDFPEAARALREALPDECFKKPSLASLVDNASSRAGNTPAGKAQRNMAFEK